MPSAREFFEAVSSAARDAERCRSLLETMEQRALAVSKPALEGRVKTSGADVMAKRVGAYVDRETLLHARIEEDYRLIDMAVAVLYGDGLKDGLASLAPAWWADVLDLRYIEGMTWAEVGAVVCYSPSHVRLAADAALDLLDAHGLVATEMGRGFATDHRACDSHCTWRHPHMGQRAAGLPRL